MSAPINIAIRADAGHALGTGHFGRAAAITEALLAFDDVGVTLVTTDDARSLVAAYFPEAVKTLSLAQASPVDVIAAFAGLQEKPAVLYLDQYGTVAGWEDMAAKANLPLVVLDDLGEARAAQVVVRPVLAADAAALAPQSIALDGLAYLPLSSHVRAAFPDERPMSAEFRVNVCFGGSDPTGETLKALEALAPIENTLVDVVIGPRTRISPDAMKRFEKMPHFHFHHAPTHPQIVDLLHRADVALGAGGVMQWERLCIGVPTVVVTVADNQTQQVRWMVEQGLIVWIGDHNTATPDAMYNAVKALRDNAEARADLVRRGRALVDGRGAIRVAAAIRAQALRARDVVSDDAEALLAWRIHPTNWRFNLSAQDVPTLAAHKAWMAAKLADPSCVFKIILQDETPIAVVRFDIDTGGHSAALSIYLVPAHHGRKLGLPVYMAAEHALSSAHSEITTITSHIHSENAASRRLHIDAGFDLRPDPEKPQWLRAIRAV